MAAQAIIPLSEGFLLGLGLIVGFGPQNSFILQQGTKREYVLLIALLASLIDFLLIALGVGGAASFFEGLPLVMAGVTCFGICFLTVYGFKSFKSAFTHSSVKTNVLAVGRLGPKAVVFAVLAVSLLNPTAYLDTMFIIGGSALRYAEPFRVFFAVGAAIASVVWFFALAFGAAKLSKTLKSPLVAKSIDIFSAVVMWGLAARLLFTFF